MWIEVNWPDSQDLFDFSEEEGFDSNVIATDVSGSYLVNEDWLNSVMGDEEE